MSTRPPTPTGLPPGVARRLVALACRAPSVHNTQPWWWRIRPDGLDLYADRTRRLPVADPLGRNLVISCGAALQHVQVAAAAMGWGATVTRLPDPDEPDLLARIRFAPAPAPRTAAADLRALRERCTDRRRFTSWPVPDDRLRGLAATASEQEVDAIPLTDVTDRFRVELLVSRAVQVQARDASLADEARRWVDRAAGEGVPATHLPVDARVSARQSNRFGPGDLEDRVGDVEGADGLIVLCDTEDSPGAWLRCGEALSALWLRAVAEGMSVVPLSQVVEVAETRAALQHEVFGGAVVPLMVVRIGWQAISRSHLEPTQRRPLDEVLLG